MTRKYIVSWIFETIEIQRLIQHWVGIISNQGQLPKPMESINRKAYSFSGKWNGKVDYIVPLKWALGIYYSWSGLVSVVVTSITLYKMASNCNVITRLILKEVKRAWIAPVRITLNIAIGIDSGMSQTDFQSGWIVCISNSMESNPVQVNWPINPSLMLLGFNF